MSKYVILGAGGIGCAIAEPLSRFLAYNREPGADVDTLIIVDGDIVESKNVARQHDLQAVGKNKAEVLADKLRGIVGSDLDIQIVTSYFTEDKKNLPCHKLWLEDGVHVFGCVDNDKTRVLIEKTLCEFDNGVFIVGGNSFDCGQAQLFVRRDKRNLTPKITELAPEILEEDPTDLFPDDTDCLNLAVSHPQLVFANFAVANAMLNIWYSWRVSEEIQANEIVVNVGRATARHTKRQLTLS